MSVSTISRSNSGPKTYLKPEFALIEDNIALLDAEVKKCIEKNELRVVIDFESIPYIDSAGLEKLLDCYNEIRRSGGRLEISNPNPLCNEILNVTGITDYIDIYFNLEKAAGGSHAGD